MTPTSKCCDKCNPTGLEGHCFFSVMENKCECHTPTTDSKNSSERSTPEILNARDQARREETTRALRDLRDQVAIKNTADTGWESRLGKLLEGFVVDAMVAKRYPILEVGEAIVSPQELKTFIRTEKEKSFAEGERRGRKEVISTVKALGCTKARNLWDYEMVVTQDALFEALTPLEGSKEEEA